MPRALTGAFATAVAAGAIRPAIFVDMFFDSGTLRIWSGVGSYVMGGSTYTGAGTLMGVDAVDEGSDVQARGTKLTLSGIDSSIVSLALSEPVQNRRVIVWLGLFDAAGALIASADKVFDGRADTLSLVDDGAMVTISLAVESMFIDLQRARARRYEHEDQQLDYPGDLGFAFVTQIQDQQIQWGPKS